MSSGSNAPRVSTRGALLLSSSELSEGGVTPEISSGPEAATTVNSTPQVTFAAQGAGTQILVVEDERIVGLHLKQQLVKLGYKVAAVVSSGEEALKVIAERRLDLVLMDIHIDGAIDGIETAKQIKVDYTLPVIYLTAFSSEGTLQRARESKPYGYLLKPFSERELHATIQMTLERCREDQEARDREDRLLIALGLAEGRRTWC